MVCAENQFIPFGISAVKCDIEGNSSVGETEKVNYVR
jgi:translation elongation factor EF-1beta